jgi:hypothetical protein
MILVKKINSVIIINRIDKYGILRTSQCIYAEKNEGKNKGLRVKTASHNVPSSRDAASCSHCKKWSLKRTVP